MDDLERRYQQFTREWCAQHWDAWQRTVTPDYRFDPGIGEELDLDGTLAWSRAIFAAFPDYAQDLTHVIVQGRTVVGVAIARGTFTGVLEVGDTTWDGTSRTFELPYVKVVEFDNDGLVHRDRQYMDHGALMAAVLRPGGQGDGDRRPRSVTERG